MNAINKVVIGGNLVRDPEVKYTPKGTAVCEATIANNESWTSESGERKERVTWVGLVLWGKTGEAFAQYHKKGAQVLVEGCLAQETWEDKETGKKREKTKVRVDSWFFVGSKSSGSGNTTPSTPPRAAAPKAPAQADGPPHEEDDVPF